MITRETKVGLMMVALLVGVFGFLLYKKIHRPLEGLAKQETAEAVTEEGDEETFAQPDNLPRIDSSDVVQFEKPETRSKERDLAKKPRASDEFETRSAKRDEEFAAPVVAQPKIKLPPPIKPEEDDFEQLVEQPVAKKPVPRELPIEPAQDAFDDFSTTSRREARSITQVAAVADEDPFGTDGAQATEAEEEPPTLEAPSSGQTLSVPAALDDETEEVDNAQMEPTEQAQPLNAKPRQRSTDDFSTSRSSAAGRPVAVQQTSDFDSGLEPAPRPERKSAPVAFEEKSFSPEGSPRQAAGGPTYVIEPSDSFWSISQKKYGAGRYFMALARHNESVISDPKRMKPGVTISTPPVAVLEQKYPELISKPAAEPAPKVATTQSRKPENKGPAGFFVSPEGVPMYRISDQDTLSTIAKSHLGRSSRWIQILEMNRNVLQDGNDLKIGTVLRLPADASRVQVVGNPREIR